MLDFYSSSLRLGVEIDGDSHFESYEAIEYDKQRENYLKSIGINIIRFTNQEVIENLEKVISIIEEKVKGLQKNCAT